MDAPANCVFSTPVTSPFNAMCFNENPFTSQCEIEDRSSYGFQILRFCSSFSTNIMAVMGLIDCDNLLSGHGTAAGSHGDWCHAA